MPNVISCRVVVIFDSSNVIISPILNAFDDKIDISISVAEFLLTICPTAPVSEPIIFYPNIDSVFNDNPDGKVNLSKVGDNELSDS